MLPYRGHFKKKSFSFFQRVPCKSPSPRQNTPLAPSLPGCTDNPNKNRPQNADTTKREGVCRIKNQGYVFGCVCGSAEKGVHTFGGWTNDVKKGRNGAGGGAEEVDAVGVKVGFGGGGI